MGFGDKVVAQIRRDGRVPEQEPSELERAFMNYKDMERDRAKLQHDNNELRIENGKLVAEVNMLREALERSDNDRIRLQSVSSTLLGQLMSINAVIAEAVRLSIKHGLEATQEHATTETKQLDEAGAEAQEIIQRTAPALPPNVYGK